MIVRALTATGDWTYGKGLNDYKFGLQAVAQSIQTRLSSFFGDCFFDTNAGIDWLNLLGSKEELALQLSVAATILNTPNVVSLISSSVTSNSRNRTLLLQYSVLTVFGTVTRTVSFSTDFLTTQGGDPLLTQDGDNIIV